MYSQCAMELELKRPALSDLFVVITEKYSLYKDWHWINKSRISGGSVVCLF